MTQPEQINHLYPASAHAEARRILGAFKDTRINRWVKRQASVWLRKRPACAVQIHEIPADIPDWAQQVIAAGGALHELRIDEGAAQKLTHLSHWLQDIARTASARKADPEAKAEASKRLKSLNRTTVDQALEHADRWFDLTARRMARQRLAKKTDRAPGSDRIETPSGREWLRLQPNELKAVGQRLKNCLARGFYSGDVARGHAAVWGLFDDTGAIAAARFDRRDSQAPDATQRVWVLKEFEAVPGSDAARDLGPLVRAYPDPLTQDSRSRPHLGLIDGYHAGEFPVIHEGQHLILRGNSSRLIAEFPKPRHQSFHALRINDGVVSGGRELLGLNASPDTIRDLAAGLSKLATVTRVADPAIVTKEEGGFALIDDVMAPEAVSRNGHTAIYCNGPADDRSSWVVREHGRYQPLFGGTTLNGRLIKKITPVDIEATELARILNAVDPTCALAQDFRIRPGANLSVSYNDDRSMIDRPMPGPTGWTTPDALSQTVAHGNGMRLDRIEINDRTLYRLHTDAGETRIYVNRSRKLLEPQWSGGPHLGSDTMVGHLASPISPAHVEGYRAAIADSGYTLELNLPDTPFKDVDGSPQMPEQKRRRPLIDIVTGETRPDLGFCVKNAGVRYVFDGSGRLTFSHRLRRQSVTAVTLYPVNGQPRACQQELSHLASVAIACGYQLQDKLARALREIGYGLLNGVPVKIRGGFHDTLEIKGEDGAVLAVASPEHTNFSFLDNLIAADDPRIWLVSEPDVRGYTRVYVNRSHELALDLIGDLDDAARHVIQQALMQLGEATGLGFAAKSLATVGLMTGPVGLVEMPADHPLRAGRMETGELCWRARLVKNAVFPSCSWSLHRTGAEREQDALLTYDASAGTVGIQDPDERDLRPIPVKLLVDLGPEIGRAIQDLRSLIETHFGELRTGY
ncbi:hypothetical protein CKO28_01215 [Rhodovibrio sodomensis]|uniref:Uncharacterized protein n=1 Tax=Rhodovibrio sodomensis TaxID=1088 RepID=A0ABS1DAN7_9PROT|nr:hypothetical protein [Rhodovibrio sodomensis]MBK1666663.1 hypothetical protein [Rhodovibrio sodomensis]